MSVEQLMEMGVDPFDAPVPGESLTSNPEQRMPYEKPPRLVDEQEAIEEVFMRITDEEVLDDILDLMRAEMPVEDIAQVILFEGFRTGQYTPDMLLLLVEPTIYILLALSEYAGINAVIYPEDPMEIDVDQESGSRALSSLNDLLKGKGDQQAVALESTEDGMMAGDQKIPMPESITPSMLESIRSKVGGAAGKNEMEEETNG